MKVPGIPYIQGRNAYADGDGRKYGLAFHNTANDASARGEASYATRRTDGTSSHFYADDIEIIQSLDTDSRAGHAGSSEGNGNAIAVEITGVNSWTRAEWLDRVAWTPLARVNATLCLEYDIEPRRASVAEMRSNPRVRAFYGHDDMRRAWGGTTHTDPGPSFPWDHLINTTKVALSGQEEDPDMMTPADFLKILQDPDVARLMRALPWQYRDGNGPSAHGIVLADSGRINTKLDAILGSVSGQGVAAILARIDQVAQAEIQRDAAAAAERASLAALLQAHTDGSLDAAEVVREMGRIMAGGA